MSIASPYQASGFGCTAWPTADHRLRSDNWLGAAYGLLRLLTWLPPARLTVMARVLSIVPSLLQVCSMASIIQKVCVLAQS
jgi:hypothetical protein